MITVDTHREQKPIRNFWNNIHFHPTDAIEDDWGRRILDAVAEDRVADTVRMYAMLEDIVSIGEDGAFLYDFTLNDERLDYMIGKGFDIFLSYNFIPPCIAKDANRQSKVCKNKTRYKGKMICVSPPRDYALWEEICYRYTEHIVARYGLDTVAGWHLQCYNEPDIPNFFMNDLGRSEEDDMVRLREYLNLYRAFVRGVSRVSDRLKVGGPALAEKYAFMDGFLKRTKQENIKLDYVCFHTYGTSPMQINDGSRPLHAENTIAKHLDLAAMIAHYYPDGMEIIVDEWGASSHGFCNREECPKLLFREGSGYAAYMGKMITAYIERDIPVSKMLICLSGQHEMTTDFSGFRNFFTLNFIRKPIYNSYILTRKLGNIVVESHTDIDGLSVLATKNEDGKLSLMLSYASEHFDEVLPTETQTVSIRGIAGKYRVTAWRIDDSHTNPYTLSLRMGIGDTPSAEEIRLLREEGMLKAESGEAVFDGCAQIPVTLENNALLLLELQPY